MSSSENVRRCVRAGIAIAAIYSTWVLILYLVSGTRAFDKMGTSLGMVVVFYFSGGIVGGAIVGLLWPLAKWRIGAYFTSLIAAAVLAFGGYITLFGSPARWDPTTLWIAFPAATLIFGVAFGNRLWKEASTPSDATQRSPSDRSSGGGDAELARTSRHHRRTGLKGRGESVTLEHDGDVTPGS